MFCFVPGVHSLPASSDSRYLYIALKEFRNSFVAPWCVFGWGLAMDCTSLERLIIDALPTTLPRKLAYVLPQKPRGDGFLMWDMQILCAADQTLNPRCDKKDWKKMLINVMSKEGVSEHLTMRKPDDPKHWQGYLMTTNAFLFS